MYILYNLQHWFCQTQAKDGTHNEHFVTIWEVVHLLCKEKGGVFSALSEGDRKESQGDVHLPGVGGQSLGLDIK